MPCRRMALAALLLAFAFGGAGATEPPARVQQEWVPVLLADTRQNKDLEQDGDSKRSHLALKTLKRGTLRIGTYFVNPPFEYVAHHARIGFEVDLMEEIARRIGLKPEFVNTRWEKILKEMQHARYDCIVGGITINPEREQNSPGPFLILRRH